MTCDEGNRIHSTVEVSRGLSSVVEMAIRSKVLITMNINTDMEMCNGARGEVVQIWADPQEGVNEETSVQEMQYPPSCILIKMDRTREGQLEGLEENTIPLFLITQTVDVVTQKGEKQRIQHQQVALDLLYVFTDYQAQGQTIKHLWADVGTPLRGHLTPFNAYVTLSRAQGRNSVRLVRDFEDSLFTTTPCEVLEREDE